MGKGLGSFLGGYLYAGLGASLCFRVCTVLPSISLLLLSLPAAQSWFKCKEKRWQDVIGEIGLEGWGQEDLHKPAPVSPFIPGVFGGRYGVLIACRTQQVCSICVKKKILNLCFSDRTKGLVGSLALIHAHDWWPLRVLFNPCRVQCDTRTGFHVADAPPPKGCRAPA